MESSMVATTDHAVKEATEIRTASRDWPEYKTDDVRDAWVRYLMSSLVVPLLTNFNETCISIAIQGY